METSQPGRPLRLVERGHVGHLIGPNTIHHKNGGLACGEDENTKHGTIIPRGKEGK